MITFPEQANEKPGRRRRSSSSRGGRKRTLSGRSVSDHSDIEMDTPLKSDIETDDDATETSKTSVKTNGSVIMNNDKGDNSHDLKTLKEELKSFIQNKLRTRFILSLSEFRRQFAMKSSQCPAQHEFWSDVSEEEIEKCVISLGGQIVPMNQVKINPDTLAGFSPGFF